MGGLSSRASLGVNLAMSQQARKKEKKALEKERDRKLRDIRERDAGAERDRRQALRERQAQQRARAGASGIASTGGSIDAVLRGLEKESEHERSDRQRDTARQIEALREAHSRKSRRNLLDFSSRFVGSAGRSLRGLARGRRSLLD